MSLSHPKIMDPEELLTWLEPRRTQTIVFTNGCFDILHPGHVDYLARAKALGHILVLALNTDDSVRRLGKTPPRPVNPLQSRAYVAAHLQSVDAVTWFDQDTPTELIQLVQPNILVKGGDWPVEQIVGRDTVLATGGQVLSLPLLPGFSTTSLLDKIKRL